MEETEQKKITKIIEYLYIQLNIDIYQNNEFNKKKRWFK